MAKTSRTVGVITLSESLFTYISCDEKIIDTLNRNMASAARYWIVGRNEDVLAKYIDPASRPKEDLDTEFQAVKYLKHGYIIE